MAAKKSAPTNMATKKEWKKFGNEIMKLLNKQQKSIDSLQNLVDKLCKEILE